MQGVSPCVTIPSEGSQEGEIHAMCLLTDTPYCLSAAIFMERLRTAHNKDKEFQMMDDVFGFVARVSGA